MNEILYCVVDQYGTVIARDLNMDNAMIFVRALFDRYYSEDNIEFTIKKQNEAEAVVNTLSDNELAKVFDYKNADKARVGMKGYFANTLQALKSEIDADFRPLELTEILGEECLTRFRNSEGFAAELFYPVEE